MRSEIDTLLKIVTQIQPIYPGIGTPVEDPTAEDAVIGFQVNVPILFDHTPAEVMKAAVQKMNS